MNTSEYHKEIDILFDRTQAKGIRSLAITSSVHQEGVSSTALALAQRGEQAGLNVLLLELNTSSPILPNLYPGIISKNFPDIFRISAYFSCASTVVHTALSDIWQRKNFIAFLQTQRELYDLIIVDVPPVTSDETKYLPSEIICSCCDATLLCVLFSRTQESDVKSALKKLHHTETHILGYIANDCFNPPLADELIRETFRLESYAPGLMARLRRRLSKSHLLSLRI
ncbi:tyrosine-protein kinase family protein [Plesiomonas shigelloides]|uniref:tyrosine-protein kinase family protein n=1 Tax=Plesiomonas shigelloides TaxID=703 RepID=UPI001261CC70|nr:hypothetical protein [Plesiomonas shigelloides]KAB7697611.1 hypothetical protein GBN15_07305 [Plesiomonas shigelloides]